MIKDIETLGLKVESIRPSTNESGVETNTDIKIKFNADVLAKTIVGNVCVYEDTNNLFNGTIDPTELVRINGKISYESKTIIFTPNEELNENKQYIIVVKKDGIKDIIGRSLLFDNISTFFTKANKSFVKPNIISPLYGETLTETPIIEFTDMYDVYNVQISKNSEFDTYVINDVVNSLNATTVKYKPNIALKDGLYFIRVKAHDSVFSDTIQVYIQSDTGLVSEEDYDDLIRQFDEVDLELLECFPNRDKVAGVNIKTIYLKFKGNIGIEKLNINKTSLIGELFDETDSDVIEEDGYAETKIYVVYDDEEDVTYVINSV